MHHRQPRYRRLKIGYARAAQAADIVDTAASAGQFNTLVAAVKAAGLVDTLKGEGPYTVFAPTDEAFAKLWNVHKLRTQNQKGAQVGVVPNFRRDASEQSFRVPPLRQP